MAKVSHKRFTRRLLFWPDFLRYTITRRETKWRREGRKQSQNTELPLMRLYCVVGAVKKFRLKVYWTVDHSMCDLCIKTFAQRSLCIADSQLWINHKTINAVGITRWIRSESNPSDIIVSTESSLIKTTYFLCFVVRLLVGVALVCTSASLMLWLIHPFTCELL